MKKLLKLLLQIIIFIGLKIKEFFTAEAIQILGIILLFIAGIVVIMFVLGNIGFFILPDNFLLFLFKDDKTITNILNYSALNMIPLGGMLLLILIFGSSVIVGIFLLIKILFKINTWKIIKNFIKANWKQSKEITDRVIK